MEFTLLLLKNSKFKLLLLNTQSIKERLIIIKITFNNLFDKIIYSSSAQKTLKH